MTALKAPARAPKIQFSHFGINVRDLDLMEDFYTRVVRFTVTDRGAVEALCRDAPGFQPYGAWRDRLATKLNRPIVAKPF
jgi:catechol 2,3-dioxygenase-like lactoylglutathione lyase family enzyme